MKVNIHAKGTKPHRQMRNWLRNQIGQIQQLANAQSAVVALERDPVSSPAYRVRMKLIDAEPDLAVEITDHNLHDATAKAVRELGVKAWAQSRSWIPRRIPTKRNAKAATAPSNQEHRN